MSPQDADVTQRLRPRSNTNTFTSFGWRRGRLDPVPAHSVTPPLPIDDLIRALTPPAVPAPSYARTLASALATCSPLPSISTLNPIISSLCASTSPAALQATGYDILSAYCENGGAASLTTADKVSYFPILFGSTPWSHEIWEPRYRALCSLTKSGSDLIGLEGMVLNILRIWIEGAFEGLIVVSDAIEQFEKDERERSVQVLATFVSSFMQHPYTMARFSEEQVNMVLQLYASFLDRSLDLMTYPTARDVSSSSSPDLPSSNTSTPSKLHLSHRRHPSSLSLSLEGPPIALPGIPSQNPASLSVGIYLDYLSVQIRVLSSSLLNLILPLLFRALSFFASPLPRLTLVMTTPSASAPEDKITETLFTLLTGPYASSCMRILKQCLVPPPKFSSGLLRHIQISVGAHRALRNYIRRGLYTRLVRAYIVRESSLGYAPSGAPGHMDLGRDLMEHAWPKDDVSSWDPAKLGRICANAVDAWVDIGESADSNQLAAQREKIYDEVAGTLKDILQEVDSREEDASIDNEEASAIGETLHSLARYVRPIRNQSGTPLILSLSHPTDAPSPFLRTLSSLLSREHTLSLNPLLSTTLLSIADHLSDVDTAKIPVVMSEHHDLSPTSSAWLDNWHNLLWSPTLVTQVRPFTRQAVMKSLQSVYSSIQDMPAYRKPLANLILDFCRRQDKEGSAIGGGDEVWRILGDEVVLRTIEDGISQDIGVATEIDSSSTDAIVSFLTDVALAEMDEEDDDTASINTADTQSPSPLPTFPVASSSAPSPVLSRMQSDSQGLLKEKEAAKSSVMSILSTFTTGAPRSQSQSRRGLDYQSAIADEQEVAFLLPRGVGGVVSLVSIFSQLSFTISSASWPGIQLSVRIYLLLLDILLNSKSSKVRLAILQFLMRLRADRDHRLYFVDKAYDPDGLTITLAALIHRDSNRPMGGTRSARSKSMTEDTLGEEFETRKARPRVPIDRDARVSRKASRGRGAGPSKSATSRSRSRAAITILPSMMPSSVPAIPREPLWQIPETLPFYITDATSPSKSLISYDPDNPDDRHVLPISLYVSALVMIIEKEKNWDVLSYVLCHAPVQLANKHLFCGARSREAIIKLLTSFCRGIISNELASEIERWPLGLKARDAHGLAYHTLSTLISYRRCFEMHLRHLLVEVFERGLNGQPPTIKCCLHALTLSAFELQPSMTKHLPRILEKLSQIMSNPDMAVHIIGFLSIIGSIRDLHANFTEGDYKMVFGVALQYLQHHNRSESYSTISWALSQHVRIISYYLVYIWFLAVKLADRPRHVPFIVRQLLLANEGRDEVDEPTEVCFDWLARYTYASADPRPANTLLNDLVMHPPSYSAALEASLSEKTWVVGSSILTVRTLARLGWVEVVCRRPSGYTKFLCRAENVPMVSAGDVNPDISSIPAALLMERDYLAQDDDRATGSSKITKIFEEASALPTHQDEIGTDSLDPDPVTGYIWSGSAPSQRRKTVAVDPSFFILQLSSYPENDGSLRARIKADPASLPSLFRALDRTPVIDTHKVGILYVAPGQTKETEILRNTHGSPAYTRFLEGLGRLINIRGQVDVYAGGLDPDEDGEYAYAWWDDIGQILYHTATMMPSKSHDEQSINKKVHIGNDFVRIVWNDSGIPYRFDTLSTQFQFVNIVIEPHSLGAIAAFSNNIHENEYFKITVQRAPDMTEFAPVGHFKVISAESLPLLVRQLSLLADWFTSVFVDTENDTKQVEVMTNWRHRLQIIKRFRSQMASPDVQDFGEGIMSQEVYRDFTTAC